MRRRRRKEKEEEKYDKKSQRVEIALTLN